MLAALHLFRLPDADVLVHLGDGAPEGLPLLQVWVWVWGGGCFDGVGGNGGGGLRCWFEVNALAIGVLMRLVFSGGLLTSPFLKHRYQPPSSQPNINRGFERAGFAIPKKAWRDALGPEQLAVLTDCIEVR